MTKKEKVMKNQQKAKIVLNASVARKLLKMGYSIIDIKPKKEDRTHTNFVFKVEGNFMNDYSKLMNIYEGDTNE